MSKDLTTLKELFAYLELEYVEGDDKGNQERFSREIYKHTECGAWAKILPPGNYKMGTEEQRWKAVLGLDVDGLFVLSLSHDGKDFDPKGDLPLYVREYFCIPTPGSSKLKVPDPGHFFKSLSVEMVPGEKGLPTKTVEENVTAPKMEWRAGGVHLGSIVEGSDAEVDTDPLLLPFSREAFDKTIEYIEGEVSILWDKANGNEDEE